MPSGFDETRLVRLFPSVECTVCLGSTPFLENMSGSGLLGYRTVRFAVVALSLLLPFSSTLLAGHWGVTFEHLSMDNGLSGRIVPCMLQDSTGYLWFGTFGGLDRYDGYSFKSYRHNPDNPTSLTNGTVLSLCEDRSGNMWVGTSQGLEKLDCTTGTFTHVTSKPSNPGVLSNDVVSALHLDPHGILWIGTRDGLKRHDPSTGTFTCLRHDECDPSSLSSNSIEVIYEDRAGVLWVGTGSSKESARGLERLDRENLTFTHYRHKTDDSKSIASDLVTSIFEDHSGILWVGTWGGGLDRFDRTTGTFIHHRHAPGNPLSISSDKVHSICEDPTGILWIGTWDGLNAFDPKRREFIRFLHDERDAESLSANKVTAVLYERSATLWVSTWDGGVNKLAWPHRGFTRYAHIEGRGGTLESNDVHSVTGDREGWCGLARPWGWEDSTR